LTNFGIAFLSLRSDRLSLADGAGSYQETRHCEPPSFGGEAPPRVLAVAIPDVDL